MARRRLRISPNGGATGTAALLGVHASLLNVLRGLAREGYDVELPADENDPGKRIPEGNAGQFGMGANVCDRVSVDDHVRREPYLNQIEAQGGPAPGNQLTDGRSLAILGAQFGNVIVTIQPGFGYEGDPMRLLFERNFAPTRSSLSAHMARWSSCPANRSACWTPAGPSD